MITLYMVQISQNLWQIKTQNNTVLKDDIVLPLTNDVEQYIKAYTSSFTGTTYEIKRLGDKNDYIESLRSNKP